MSASYFMEPELTRTVNNAASEAPSQPAQHVTRKRQREGEMEWNTLPHTFAQSSHSFDGTRQGYRKRFECNRMQWTSLSSYLVIHMPD